MKAPESSTKYVYGIIRCPTPRTFTSRAIGDRGDAVTTLHASEGDLAAVVSDSPLMKYQQSRRNMIVHTLVVEEVMRDFTILPMRFGTVAPSDTAIQTRLLTERADEFDEMLRAIDGHTERGIKAFWYEGAIFQEILTDHPDIRALRDALADRSPAETYYDRIRLGEMIEVAMQRKRDTDAEHLLAHLRPLAHDMKLNAVVSDRMVLNAAFLVENKRGRDFDQAVQHLDETLGSRLILKYVRVAPPYNFVSIRIHWD